MYNMSQQQNHQVLPNQHGVIGGQRPPKMTTTVSQTHLFAPSTAVWGHSELSVGPVNTGLVLKHLILDISKNHFEKQLQFPDSKLYRNYIFRSDESLAEVRSRVHFHLCNIFPHDFVESVMAANPEEVNAPVLCELIIRAQKEYRK